MSDLIKKTPTERLELSTPGLEVRCAIQLRQDGLFSKVLRTKFLLKASITQSQENQLPMKVSEFDKNGKRSDRHYKLINDVSKIGSFNLKTYFQN